LRTSGSKGHWNHYVASVALIRKFAKAQAENSGELPNRDTSAIRARGVEPTVVEYLKDPPSAVEIRAILKDMGIPARGLLRRRGTPYDELGLDGPKWTDSELIAAMAKHPVLIERPVVRTRRGARLCRPAARLKDIL
jgi:arsenate reductase